MTNIPQTFLKAFPELSVQKAQTYFQKYIKVVSSHILPIAAYAKNNELDISLKAINDQCGQFRYKGQLYYIWNEFKNRYAFFTVLETGSNLSGKKSKIKINKRVNDMIANQAAEDIFMAYVEQDISKWNSCVPINMENLNNYIENTERSIKQATDFALQDTLKKYLSQARIVYGIGSYMEETYNQPLWPMVAFNTIYGRTHYRGFSIQLLHKVVREAVIGEHYQYDINAAVYGIKLGIYNNLYGGESNIINTTLGTYTREYLREKKDIRKRLAYECFKSISVNFDYKLKMVKQALTAISFGARVTSGFYNGNGDKGPALTEIIKSKECREAFLNDRWVKKFIEEQNTIDDAIIEAYKSDGRYDQIKDIIKTVKPAQARISKAMILSFIFQQYEAWCMDTARSLLGDDNIICSIHDAILVKRQLCKEELKNIESEWGVHLTEFLTMDYDHITNWRPASVIELHQQVDIYEEEHRKRIKAEDYSAKQFIAYMAKRNAVNEIQTN